MTDVGLEIKRAMERAEHHIQMCPRKMKIRFFMYDEDGRGRLRITGWITAQNAQELEEQMWVGTRVINWEDLQEQAGKLTGMVDEIAIGLEEALGITGQRM